MDQLMLRLVFFVKDIDLFDPNDHIEQKGCN